VRILEISHVERWVSRVEHEKDRAKSEKIDNLSLIGLFSVDFWGHEAERSDD